MGNQPEPARAGRSQRNLTIITILLMAAIAAAGYFVGRDRPIPDWIERFLMPGLGWLGLVLIVIIAVDWIKQRQG